MESIEINGFLTIDYAHLEIKKINILIGEQAQGKSVIAKLVYFFKTFFPEIFIPSVGKLESKRELDKKSLAKFETIFPRYTWTDQEFSIIYSYENYAISIIRAKIKNKFTLKFNYSKELLSYHRFLKNTYQKALSKNKFIEEVEKEEIFYEIMNAGKADYIVSNASIFIPAGRSFFANLQKNIFSFLASNIDIDPLIKEFGSRYEQSRRFHQSNIVHPPEISRSIIKVKNYVNDIIMGEYIYADDQDWISKGGKRTNLAHASSGQQESLPMLLILKTWPFVYGQGKPAIFFMEEPEAHLFPTAQKQIISLLATIYNSTNCSFFITTHSPYILTAINNLVVGQDAYDKAKASANNKQLKKLAGVLPADELIHLDDVSAYTINQGKLESIIDLEDRLIGANLLDTVSDEFDIAFAVAVDVLYGED